MLDKLKERLGERVVIFDGAMGTELYKRHYFVNISYESLCLSAPDVILEIHRSYREAGAEVLTTNTYNANANKLASFGMADKVDAINRKAVELARKAADGADILIAGSVGPVGEASADSGLDHDKMVGILADQVRALEEGGADFIFFETISSLKDTEMAFEAINRGSKLPYVLSFSLDRNAETAKGESASTLLAVLQREGRKPTALGLNCGEGPESILNTFEKFKELVDYPVVIQPNAGVPKVVDSRMMYMTSPEYLATYAKRYADMGARGIGGCCGTGPEHIRDIARSVSPLSKSEFASKIIVREEAAVVLKEPALMEGKSRLGKKLAEGGWVTCVEIVPPRGFTLDETIEKSRQCREAGVDAINVPDGPRASSRISPIITAMRIQEQAGIEAILHFCCRDKNLIGMQADLLGCANLGLRNILFVTGDPPKLGDYPFASAVFDLDSIGMVKIQSRMNRGVDVGGKPIDPPTKALIGVGADPNAIDMKRELRRIREKIEAGAEFIQTQPVFATEPLLRFVENIAEYKVPVIAGIWPLASYRNAEFMKNEVPGVVVPDSVMKRMSKAESKEDQRKEGVSIARECVETIRGYVRGVQVSAPFGNVGTALDVIKN